MLARSLAPLLMLTTLAGCAPRSDGGNPHNEPIAGLNYSPRHTYPLVAAAVLQLETRSVKSGDPAMHAWDFSSQSDVSLEKIVREKFAAANMAVISHAQVIQRDGQFVDSLSGKPVHVWTITVTGGQRDQLVHRVDIRASAKEVRRYEVILHGSERSPYWSAAKLKAL